MREAAMSSIARVIFFVDCTDLIRRRYSRSWAPTWSALLVRVGLRVLAVRLDRLLTLFVGLHGVDLLVLHERLARGGVEGLLEVGDRRLERLDGVVGELTARDDRLVDALVPVLDVVEELLLEAPDVLDRHLVDLPGRAGPDRDDLPLHREGRVLRLLEQLDQTRAAL